MKSLSEKIDWYKEPETRRWKRALHGIELLLIALLAVGVMMLMLIHGNGAKLQPLSLLFTGGIVLSSLSLAPSFYRASGFKRWHIQLVTLGLGCGLGISAVAALVILELQLLG